VISHKVWGKNAFWPLGEFFIQIKKKRKKVGKTLVVIK
jgi:hypothetical protein